MGLKLKTERKIATALFLSLPFILFAVFYFYPIGYTVFLSLHEWNGISPAKTPVGLANYAFIIKNHQFRISLGNTVRWLIIYVTCVTGLGLGLALLLEKKIKGSQVFETIIFLPTTIMLIAAGAMWRWLYNPHYGFINIALRKMGLDALTLVWLGDPQIVTYSIMICGIWSGVGLAFVLYLAGLNNIPSEYREAARIDGASFLQLFRHITWPMLAPANAVVMAMMALRAIKVFDIVYVLTNGGPGYASSVLAFFMYDTSFARGQFGRGAAIATVLFLVSALIIGPYLIYSVRKVEAIR
jgi:ABC-type sugar transport system permease subunit